MVTATKNKRSGATQAWTGRAIAALVLAMVLSLSTFFVAATWVTWIVLATVAVSGIGIIANIQSLRK